MLRRYPLCRSLTSFGFRNASTLAQQYSHQDKSQEMTRLRSAIKNCIEHKKPICVANNELLNWIETFETASAISLHKGDTVKSHLYNDCASACQIMRELESSITQVRALEDKTRIALTGFALSFAAEAMMHNTITLTIFAGACGYSLSLSYQQKKIADEHENLFAKHVGALKETNKSILDEIAIEVYESAVKCKV